ncbi:MAG: DNA internalization-related competence protein ComEC/Rec2 [Desulfovibrio sp.]|nr:MAG: DNA internalization-related competence protein ComEC/Rec2 [Desulfovibrio sp.]
MPGGPVQGTSLQSNVSEGGWFPPLVAWQFLVLAFAGGILSLEYPLPALLGVAVILALAITKGRGLLFWLVFGLVFAAGYGAAFLDRPAFPDPDSLLRPWMVEREKVRVTGRVEQVSSSYSDRLRLTLVDVSCELEDGTRGELPGKVKWSWEYPEFRPLPGQVVALTTRIRPVRSFADPGTWDTETYWARQGVFHTCYTREDKADVSVVQDTPTFFSKVRNGLFERFLTRLGGEENLSQGQAMLAALLFGERMYLDVATADNMARASLSHTLALSGLHVGFMALFGVILAHAVGRLRPGLYLCMPRPKLAVLFAAPLILIYVWLGQGSPSLVRAAIMFGSWGLLLLLNRGRVLMEGLFMALALILIFSPSSMFDLRLQLSAMAVAGIGVFVEGFGPWRKRVGNWAQDALWRRMLARGLDLLGVSVAANVALLPLVVENFGELTPHLWTNVVWLPILGMVVMPLAVLGLVLCMSSLTSPLAGRFFDAAAWILDGLCGGLTWMEGQGLLQVSIPPRPGWTWGLGYWTLLVCGMFLLQKMARRAAVPGKQARINQWRVWAVALFAVACMAWPFVQEQARIVRGQVTLTVLDVGQGQSLVLETPDGSRTLIDGGGFLTDKFDVGKAIVAKVLTRNRQAVLDRIVVSHPDLDHIRGTLYPLERFEVGEYVGNGKLPGGEWDLARLERALADADMQPQVWRAGDVIDLGQGVALEVLHPSPDFESTKGNDHSLVMRLTWQGHGLAYLPGDVETKAINRVLEEDVEHEAQVLLLPHHGSKSSTSPELYQAVDPDLAVASCGYLNYWRFPSAEVRQALEEADIPLLTTPECGAIRFSWAAPDQEPEIQTMRECMGSAQYMR